MAWTARLRDWLWNVMEGGSWPGMDRRLLLRSGDRLGYRSVQIPLLFLFLLHVVMILGMFFSGPVMLVMWALGQELPDAPVLFFLFLTAISDRKILHFALGLEEPEARQLRQALVWQIRSRAARVH